MIDHPLRKLAAAALVFAAAPAGPAAFAEPAALSDGQTLYAQNCGACHQPQGQGIKGAFPALAKDAVANGPPSAAAALVLNGRGGMPAFGQDLDDRTIAAILTYVRSAFGNASSPLSPADIAGARTGKPTEAKQGPVLAH